MPCVQPPRSKSLATRLSITRIVATDRKLSELEELHKILQEKSYPYGAPPPPKSYLFGGLGWVFGFGCAVGGPFLGIGAGYALSAPGAVGGLVLPRPIAVFGGGFGAGAVCGIGFSAGLVTGIGNGYVPIGFWVPFQFAPRFLRLEKLLDQLLQKFQSR